MNVTFDVERPFTWDEHRERLARARADMERQDIDLLIVTSLQSYAYLFGVDLLSGAGLFQCTFIPREGDIVAIPWGGNMNLYEQSPLLAELVPWSDFGTEIDIAKTVLQRFGKVRRIGFETTHSSLPLLLSMQILRMLEEQDAQVIAPCDIVAQLRVRKSPTEVQVMRTAAKILDETFTAAFEAMRPGQRECDVAAAALHASYSAGGDHCIQPPLITSGINTFKHTFSSPSRRVLQRGEILVYEGGASFYRYHAVAAHSVIVGAEPSRQQRDAYRLAREIIEAGCEMIRPGMLTSDIARVCIDRHRPHSERKGACHGYSIGLGYGDIWYDQLVIDENDPSVLEEGMVLTIFGSADCGEEGWVLSVDPILVTGAGFERLTTIDPSELRAAGL